jgi:hypothetical protein
MVFDKPAKAAGSRFAFRILFSPLSAQSIDAVAG